MKKTLMAALAAALLTAEAFAAVPSQVRWGNEEADTVMVEKLVAVAASIAPESRVEQTGLLFLGRPYKGGTLEGTPETLTVRLDSLDCTTFVETVAALVLTANERRGAWTDFLHNLASVRYRNGVPDGYPSRLHYVSDWAVDNARRGNLKEVTAMIPGATHQVKTLDYMTSHAAAYPALADSATLARMKDVESTYRNHRYPVLPTSRLNARSLAAMKGGDIIAFTTGTKGLDVVHMAILLFDDKGNPRLLHASSNYGKVAVDPMTLPLYLHRNRNITGMRVFRISDDR